MKKKILLILPPYLSPPGLSLVATQALPISLRSLTASHFVPFSNGAHLVEPFPLHMLHFHKGVLPTLQASPHSIVFRNEKKPPPLGWFISSSPHKGPRVVSWQPIPGSRKQLGAPCCTTPLGIDLTSTHSALQLHNWIPVLINTFPFPNSSPCPRTISAPFSRKSLSCQIAMQYRTGRA